MAVGWGRGGANKTDYEKKHAGESRGVSVFTYRLEPRKIQEVVNVYKKITIYTKGRVSHDQPYYSQSVSIKIYFLKCSQIHL
jgi:hypothetical protein